MRRMAVFVLFDFENIVDEYVLYLLKTLSEITEEILIVSNSELNASDKESLLLYGTYVFERKNYGYDAGAYKDVFLSYLKHEELTQWDEIILLNDTFYGPFFPWKNVFDTMESKELDFWGLTKLEKGMWGKMEKIPCHVQSYFIVVRKSLLKTSSFFEFWEKLEYPDTLEKAVKNFEIYFSVFYSDRGFKYAVYTDFQENSYMTDKTVIPYEYYMYELIAQSKLPILKRKPLSVINYSKVSKTIRYIEQNTNYDINLIRNHLRRMEEGGKVLPLSGSEIDFFCKKHENVYIYGNGKYGKEVRRYLEDKYVNIKGIIVSKVEENDSENLISFDDLVVTETMGIILALGKSNMEEVYPVISLLIPDWQLLMPRYE